MIGLIFGETQFPKEIIKKLKNKNKYLIIDLTKKNLFKKNKNSHQVSIGQFGKIIKIFKDNNCKKVLFAGKVEKPNFLKLKIDFKGIFYIKRIIKSSKIGDAALLKEIINIFKKEKIRTIDSLTYTPELTLSRGLYTKVKPNIFDKKDIKKAINILSKTNQSSFIQAVITRNGKLLKKEDKGGTDKLLKKCKKNKNLNSGVLIKFPKKKQDLRVDLPTVGLKTFRQCKLAGLKGVVLKNKQHIFLDKAKAIKFANKNKMFILVK